MFRQHLPDVTLMDLRLPDLSGIDALPAIRPEHAPEPFDLSRLRAPRLHVRHIRPALPV